KTKVAPIQWNVKGVVTLDDKVKKGKTIDESENDPWLFQVLSSCDKSVSGCDKDKGLEVKIGTKASGEGLYADLYAPKAGLKVNGDGDLFGAAVGRQLTIDKGQLHFDQALLNLVEICPTCTIPGYLKATPIDTLSRMRRCVAPPGGECP